MSMAAKPLIINPKAQEIKKSYLALEFLGSSAKTITK